MWLVIGYGSALHSDDRFGPAVAEAVRAAVDPVVVEVLAGTQLAPEWAEPISRASGVIFVDSSVDLPPGQLRRVRLSATGRGAGGSALTHHCTPETLLAAAATLYGQAPSAWLYAAGGVCFDLGEQLSPRVAPLVDQAAAQILDQIARG